MITADQYLSLYQAVEKSGYGDEIRWAETIQRCKNADAFACEACWVVMNAGMREQVVRPIWDRIRIALHRGEPIESLFGHKQKVKAIKYIWGNRQGLFMEWASCLDPQMALDKLQINLPFIGAITKYHLARNLGMDVCKPDRHLVRLAAPLTPAELCGRLSVATGHRVGVIDCVLWRAANLKLIDTNKIGEASGNG